MNYSMRITFLAPFAAAVAVLTYPCAARAFAQSPLPQEVQSAGTATLKVLEGVSGYVNGQRDSKRFELLLLGVTGSTSGEITGSGKNPGSMLGLALSMEKFGKVGTALKGLGAGLGIGLALADAFHLFGPTAEEQTKQALADITSKIDNLQEKLLGRIGQLETKLGDKIDYAAATTQVRAHLNRLSNLQDDLRIYADLLQDPNSKPGDIDRLEANFNNGISPNEIAEAVNGVCEQMMGDNLAVDLMEAEYRSTFGDMSAMTRLGVMVMQLVQAGQMGYELVSTIQLRRGSENSLVKKFPEASDRIRFSARLSEESIAAIADTSQMKFGKYIMKISFRLGVYAMKGTAEREANAKRYLEDRFGGTANTDRTIRRTRWSKNRAHWDAEGQHSSEGFKPLLKEPINGISEYRKKYGSLARDLKAKYLCDWLVVVYHSRQEIEDDAFTGDMHRANWAWKGSNCIWFYEKDPDFRVGRNRHVFLLCKYSPLPPPKAYPIVRPASTIEWKAAVLTSEPWSEVPDWMPGLSQADLDDGNKLNPWDPLDAWDPLDDIEALLPWMGRYTTILGQKEETGLIMQFTVGINGNQQCPNYVESFESVTELGLNEAAVEFNYELIMPDNYSSFADPEGDHRQGAFGALFLTTTCAGRVAYPVPHGKARLMFMYR